jgi:hypothetical protein
MEVKTNGRELKDAIDGVTNPALRQAFVALARLVDTSGDREVVLTADATDKKATVSVSIGEKVVVPPEVTPPYENLHWAEVDRERQDRQARQDEENAEKFVEAWQLTHREQRPFSQQSECEPCSERTFPLSVRPMSSPFGT